MSSVDILIQKLMELKPELSKDIIDEQIRIKKEKIGGGYLTDEGAIFLIAADYNITLEKPIKNGSSLKDLTSGTKEITLETRVINVSPKKEFSRKDGSTSVRRTMTVYDENTTASVTLWDEKAKLSIIENIKPGDLIKIIKAYVKSDLTGTPTLNIGNYSDIETSNETSEIPQIDSISKDISQVQDGDRDLVIKGEIDGLITTLEFTNSRGLPGKALRMSLKGNQGSNMRVVLWGKDEKDIPNMISKSAKVRLLGVRIKNGNQGLEIHGNDATQIEIEGGKEAEPVISRILSISNEDNRTMVLASDEKRNLFNIIDYAKTISDFNVGEIIECMPSKVYGNAITLDENSFVRKLDNDEKIPTLSQMRTRISDIKVDGTFCIESIIIKKPERREVQTKSGENISLSEMFVEDDTGQIWVKGWRNLAREIDKCELGEIVSITAVNAKAGLEGRIELFLTSFSSITKKS